jgi:uncharacterized protein (TIGR03067 family)
MRRYAVMALVIGLLIAADKKEDLSKKDLNELQGEWVGVSAEVRGRPVPAELVKDSRMTVQGNKMTFRSGGKTTESIFTLDPAKNPKEIDFTSKDKNGTKTRAIYFLEGDQLKLCIAWATKKVFGKDNDKLEEGKRPTKFDSNQGGLLILKRHKK